MDKPNGSWVIHSLFLTPYSQGLLAFLLSLVQGTSVSCCLEGSAPCSSWDWLLWFVTAPSSGLLTLSTTSWGRRLKHLSETIFPCHAYPLSHVWCFVTPYIAAYQTSLSMGFSKQEYWSGLPSLYQITLCISLTALISEILNFFIIRCLLLPVECKFYESRYFVLWLLHLVCLYRNGV